MARPALAASLLAMPRGRLVTASIYTGLGKCVVRVSGGPDQTLLRIILKIPLHRHGWFMVLLIPSFHARSRWLITISLLPNPKVRYFYTHACRYARYDMKRIQPPYDPPTVTVPVPPVPVPVIVMSVSIVPGCVRATGARRGLVRTSMLPEWPTRIRRRPRNRRVRFEWQCTACDVGARSDGSKR